MLSPIAASLHRCGGGVKERARFLGSNKSAECFDGGFE
jgi:hypothetical protein